MDWDTYYEKFYDWASTTQINRISSLTSFGPSCEVAEVAQELMDSQAASRLIKKAVAYGVSFTADEIYDLYGCCNTDAMNALLTSATCEFTKEQLEEFSGVADYDVIQRAAARNKVALFEDDDDDDDEEATEEAAVEDAFVEQPMTPEPKLGFFSKLFLTVGVASALSPKQKQHPGCCTGDCAHCPPHYGYRYGRWYYGHGHVHGCEFGGNKGDGSL